MFIGLGIFENLESIWYISLWRSRRYCGDWLSIQVCCYSKKKLWKHKAWCRIEQTKSEFQPLRIVVFAKGEQSGNFFYGGSINSDIPFPFPNPSEDCLGMYLLDSAEIKCMQEDIEETLEELTGDKKMASHLRLRIPHNSKDPNYTAVQMRFRCLTFFLAMNEQLHDLLKSWTCKDFKCTCMIIDLDIRSTLDEADHKLIIISKRYVIIMTN